jgi:hypothetical protein
MRVLLILRNKLTAVIIFAALLAIAGCQKCYNCYSFQQGTLTCFKLSDTINRTITSATMLTDSAKYYQGQGYTCDSLNIWIPYFNGNIPSPVICGEKLYKPAMAAGDSCAINK